ncbi:MAG: nickel pincer cofactor biosynthesis protein LarB [Verrucomicrobia bacterium]|nr:nickel pincer cofactor biosynthesis protein LarB [Verrucomicrobiota bacterium]
MKGSATRGLEANARRAPHPPATPFPPMSFVDLGFARVDTGRAQRCGFPEVVFGAGKTPEQVVSIAKVLVESHGLFLASRVERAHYELLSASFPDAKWHPVARCISIERSPLPVVGGTVGVVCAGTSDLPVAEEAVVTLEVFGNRVLRISDVGVAGIHRLLAVRNQLESCAVLIVVAGMEGALPSAVAGLTSKPVVAVPTSVGYGASFGGLAALLGMLNSCGSGVTVVNIDNGFGAAYAAAQINRLVAAAGPSLADA